METLKPYPAYNNSGVEWLGQIPDHWKVARNKLFLHEINERSTDGKEDLLTVSQFTGVTRRKENIASDNELLTNAATLVGYKKVEPDDLVINIMLAWNGSLGVSSVKGIVSPAYCVFRTISDEVIPRYLHYLLRTPLFTGAFKMVSTGVVDSRLRLYPDVFLRLPSILPPKDEQTTIVRFLDHMDRRIRRYIRTKQKLIKLLEEQKQAIIHEAVTKGLDPNVRMKPSGMECLGEVPAHWEIAALRRHWEVVDCKHLTVPFSENGLPLVSVSEVQSFTVDLSGCNRTTQQWYELLIGGGRKPKRGDIIYCRNVSVGASAYVDIDDHFAMGQDVCLIRSKTQNDRFLNYLLHSSFMKWQLEMILVGSTFKRINISEIKTLVVVVPPRVEQDFICKTLDCDLQLYSDCINTTENEIRRVLEYQTRLVGLVVTGQLDVRQIAATLPVELEKAETDGKTEEYIDNDSGPDDITGDDEAIGNEL